MPSKQKNKASSRTESAKQENVNINIDMYKFNKKRREKQTNKIKINKSESPPENTKRMNLHTNTPNILSRESLDSSYRRENIFPLIFKPRKNSIIASTSRMPYFPQIPRCWKPESQEFYHDACKYYAINKSQVLQNSL